MTPMWTAVFSNRCTRHNGRMRWSRLFDDLEAQLREQERAELHAEVAEQTRSHRGQIELADRLAADLGHRLQLRVAGAGALAGVLVELGRGWLVLDTDVRGSVRRRAVLVATPALLVVNGLSGRADPDPGTGQRRLDLRHALRAVSRDRALCRVTDVAGGQVGGTIDRVGRDHVDVSDHPEDVAPRPQQVRQVLTVPFTALATVRQL